MALTLPIAAVSTTNVDSGTDRPDLARTDILDAINKLNTLLANLSTAAGAGVLAVRDGSGKLAGDILGNAATATAATSATTAGACSGNSTTATTATNAAGTGSIGKCAENGLRIIRGTVAANGTITAGSGFTVSKTGTGDYTVTITSAFSAAATFVVSARASIMAGEFVNISYFTTGAGNSTFYIGTSVGFISGSSIGSTPADRDFDFIAIGPN